MWYAMAVTVFLMKVDFISTQKKKLKHGTFYGIELVDSVTRLCAMNLLLHGQEAPDIDPENSLRFKLSEIGERDRVDVILTNPPFGGEEEPGMEDDLSDALYDQAVQLVTSSRQASISWVQRRLRVGYNRAARMIERMERDGVVTASEGGRPVRLRAAPGVDKIRELLSIGSQM